MNWLQKLFKSKELLYLEQLYADTKKDKEQLKDENLQLKKQIEELNKQLIELLIKQKINTHNTNNIYNNDEKVYDVKEEKEIKLAPKEEFILNLCKKYKNFNDVLLNCGMKETSLKVYLSRIRTKKYEIPFDN